MLNSAHTKPHSTIAQLSPDHAPLYYCYIQFYLVHRTCVLRTKVAWRLRVRIKSKQEVENRFWNKQTNILTIKQTNKQTQIIRGTLGGTWRGNLQGNLEGTSPRRPHSTIAQLSPNQAPLFFCSTQPRPCPTPILLNSAQTKLHSTIAQLSPDQAPLYYCSTQPKPSPTLLLLNSAQTKPHSTIDTFNFT